MKKIILASAFSLMTLVSMAGTEVVATQKVVASELFDCTVSATLSIPGGTGVTITSTKSTCAAAVADVAAGIKAIKDQL